VLFALLCSAAVSAQRDLGGWGSRRLEYDGHFTFVRLRWRTGTFGGAVAAGMGPNMWAHEYPRAEQNLMSVIGDLTLINAKVNGSLILGLDDPALFRYPVAMLWEPGFWLMTDREAARLREYLLKGGFLIVNDFEDDQWHNFEGQMHRVLPSSRWIPMENSHPIFNTFFEIERPDLPHPPGHHLYGYRARYLGLFEDNNPKGRLMVIANYDTNLAEFWQMGHSGFFPIDASNNAFKLGVNYMIYALTH
jgi:hypothetical protein